ncbi:hypothetical protein [Burkholderia phage FLC9]|nr:hypothetical protein [Burkholderia phage FLC9]
MATAYTIGLVIYVAVVTFWIIRLLACLCVKDPQSRVVIALQKSFFSMCFASGKEMVYTALLYAGAALLAYACGFVTTGHGMLLYLGMLCIQWLYVNTEANRRRYDEMLLAAELNASNVAATV